MATLVRSTSGMALSPPNMCRALAIWLNSWLTIGAGMVSFICANRRVVRRKYFVGKRSMPSWVSEYTRRGRPTP